MKLWIWWFHWINSYSSFSYGANANRNDLIFNTSFWKYCHVFWNAKRDHLPLQLPIFCHCNCDFMCSLELKRTLRCTFSVLKCVKKRLVRKYSFYWVKWKKIYDQNYWRLANKLPTLLTCIAVVLIDVKTCFWPSFNEWPVSTEFSNLKLSFHFIWDGNNKKNFTLLRKKRESLPLVNVRKATTTKWWKNISERRKKNYSIAIWK